MLESVLHVHWISSIECNRFLVWMRLVFRYCVHVASCAYELFDLRFILIYNKINPAEHRRNPLCLPASSTFNAYLFIMETVWIVFNFFICTISMSFNIRILLTHYPQWKWQYEIHETFFLLRTDRNKRKKKKSTGSRQIL